MQLHQLHKDHGLEVITLNMEGAEKASEAAEILKKMNVAVTNWCLIGGASEEGLATVQGDGVLPAVNLYDREGRLRHQLTGLDEVELDRVVEELLRE